MDFLLLWWVNCGLVCGFHGRAFERVGSGLVCSVISGDWLCFIDWPGWI